MVTMRVVATARVLQRAIWENMSNPEVLFKALISPIGQFIIHIYILIHAVALTTP